MIDAPARTAWYVYGVVRPDAAAPVQRGAGLGGAPVELVEQDGIAAVVGAVDAEEFSEQRLAASLNDHAWLEAAATAHEDVLQSFAAATAVVPLRFGAIYRTLDDVRALLGDRREQFEADLGFIEGRVEFGVKISTDLAALSSRAPAVPATGRGYLERKLAEREERESAGARLRAFVGRAHEQLAQHAVASVLNRPQPRELTGRQDDMLLNAAYLVEDEATDAFVALVVELGAAAQELAATVELTGPWPPHNFVGGGEEGE